MAKTLRQYAEDIKQASGTALGVFEMFKDSTDPTTNVTNYLNALPEGALMLPFPTTTAVLAKFIVTVGPILELVAPAA